MYLHTLQWNLTEALAESRRLYAQALVAAQCAGLEAEGIRTVLRPFKADLDALQRPFWEPPYESVLDRPDLTEGQRAFLSAGREA